MGFRNRSQETSALDRVKTNAGYDNPLELKYNKRGSKDTGLYEGESVVFRMLSLSDTDAPIIPQVRAEVLFADGKLNNNILVPDPGAPHNDNLVDDAGNKLNTLKSAETMLIPVYAMFKLNSKGVITEVYEKLMFIEAKPVILQDLKALKEDFKNGNDFESIPEYPLQIEIIKDLKTYKLYPLGKCFVNEGGKSVAVSDEQLGKGQDVEEFLAFEEDEWEQFDKDYTLLVAELNKIKTDAVSVNSVKRRFAWGKEEAKEAKASAAQGPAVKKTLGKKTVSTPPPVNDGADAILNEDEVVEEVEEVVEEKVAPAAEAAAPVKRIKTNRFAPSG